MYEFAVVEGKLLYDGIFDIYISHLTILYIWLLLYIFICCNCVSIYKRVSSLIIRHSDVIEHLCVYPHRYLRGKWFVFNINLIVIMFTSRISSCFVCYLKYTIIVLKITLCVHAKNIIIIGSP